MLSPIRFAHSSTSLTVPERSRREGRLFACHSDAERTEEEEPLSFRAQGKLGEASLVRRFFVYILASKSETLYTEVTSNLETPVLQHKCKLFPGFAKKL